MIQCNLDVTLVIDNYEELSSERLLDSRRFSEIGGRLVYGRRLEKTLKQSHSLEAWSVEPDDDKERLGWWADCRPSRGQI